MRKIIVAALAGCLGLGCILPTSPAWLQGSWLTAYGKGMNLIGDGTYNGYDNGEPVDVDDTVYGTWSFDGSSITIDSDDSADPYSLAVAPLVACRIVSFGTDLYENSRVTGDDCPNMEAALTDAESPFAGTYVTGSITDEMMTVTLRSDRSFHIDWASDSGDSAQFGRWSIDSDGNLVITPLASSDNASYPVQTTSITVNGSSAQIGDQSFSFTAENN